MNIQHRTQRTSSPGVAGFTLVELLVVIVVIAVLASLILPAINSVRKRADQTKCGSNLRQFGIAWLDFEGQNNRWPDWLSSLFPIYCSSDDMYICAGDNLKGKIDGSKPQDLLDDHASDPFNETDDNWGNNGISACSYFYELCNIECGLGDALDDPDLPAELDTSHITGKKETWASYKKTEIASIEDRTKFPIIRCYHHWQDVTYKTVWDYPGGDGSAHDGEGLTINVALDGHVFHAPENWKATVLSID